MLISGVEAMYINDIFKNKRSVYSFEVFPPKKATGFEAVKETVTTLSSMPIDYMSVTYGAGGSTSKSTPDVANYIQNDCDLTALAHLTCISSSKREIKSILDDLKNKGIMNILALRGDLPENGSVATDYTHASDLISEIKSYGGFCVGGACYPEMHPDSESMEQDIENLKIKADCGCDFFVTQMFFDNDKFYEFRNKLQQKGINLPITAGIMPLTNINQIERMCLLSGGASMPSKFTRMFARYEHNPEALKQAGIAYAIDQITELLSNNINGIHLYTMNKSEVAQKITDIVTPLFD